MAEESKVRHLVVIWDEFGARELVEWKRSQEGWARRGYSLVEATGSCGEFSAEKGHVLTNTRSILAA